MILFLFSFDKLNTVIGHEYAFRVRSADIASFVWSAACQMLLGRVLIKFVEHYVALPPNSDAIVARQRNDAIGRFCCRSDLKAFANFSIYLGSTQNSGRTIQPSAGLRLIGY